MAKVFNNAKASSIWVLVSLNIMYEMDFLVASTLPPMVLPSSTFRNLAGTATG